MPSHGIITHYTLYVDYNNGSNFIATSTENMYTICDSLYENAQPRAKLLISVEAKMSSTVIHA